MHRIVASLAAVTLLLIACLACRADDAVKKPLGTWTRTVGDAEIKFVFKADGMKAHIKQGDAKFEVDADFAITKDGVLFGRVGKVTKSGAEGGPEEGDLFSFKFTVVDDKMTLDDLKGNKDVGNARELIQGEYKKSADK